MQENESLPSSDFDVEETVTVPQEDAAEAASTEGSAEAERAEGEPIEPSAEDALPTEPKDGIAESDALPEHEEMSTAVEDGENTAEAKPPKKQRGSITLKTPHLVIAAVAVVGLLVGAVGFGMWLYSRQQNAWGIDPNAKDYDFSYGGTNASADSIAIPGYSQIVLPADTEEVALILVNPQGNPCYFRFTLILEESGEVIYTSGLIPPGKAVSELRLNRGISAGEYPLLMQIETFSLDGRTPMNGANVDTVLIAR